MKELFFILSLLLTGANQEPLELSLKDVKLLALEANKDIQIQRQNLNASAGNLKEAKGIYDPKLNFSLSYTDSENPTASAFVNDGAINEQIFNISGSISGRLPTGTFYDLVEINATRTDTDSPLESLSPSWFSDVGISVGQELLRGFDLAVNNVSVVIADNNKEISVYELQKTVADTLLKIEKEYWNIIASKENLKLAQKAYELALDLEKRNKIQVEVGVLPRVSLTQAKAEVSSRLVDLIIAENELKKTKDIMKNSLSIELNREIKIVDEPTASSDNIAAIKENGIAETVRMAFERRPEVKQAQINIRSKEQLKRYYSNQRLPRLAVEGSLKYRGIGGDENPHRLTLSDIPANIPNIFDDPSDAFNNIRDFRFPSWSVVAMISFPLFNRKASGGYHEANAEYVKSVIEHRRVSDQIALEVRNAIREIKSNKRELEAVDLSVALSKEVLSNEEEKFKVGLSTTRDILEAQRDLIDSRLNQIRSIVKYNISLAEFERARGTILDANAIFVE